MALSIYLKPEDRNYEDFVEKFKPKKTTDDCYTPENIYNCIADYVSERYNLDKKNFKRPFYPGGDYENEEYQEDCVVVDNPPFSIVSKIIKFYNEHNIKFFLFCNALTAFTAASASGGCVICTGSNITYENGANVCTSFVTNLETNTRARTDAELYRKIKIENDKNLKQQKQQVNKYKYPKNVVTAAMMCNLSSKGVDFSFSRQESERISALDTQKTLKTKSGKTYQNIFGHGYLLSDTKAAEKQAAEKQAAEKQAAAEAIEFELSEREKKIIEKLEEQSRNQKQ